MIKIEELSMNALPALSTVIHQGWILRFSEGYARRGNSVSVIYPHTGDLSAQIEYCESLYQKQKLPPTFKVTSHEAYRCIDEALMERGYEIAAKTMIMAMDLKSSPESVVPEGFELEISHRLTDEWFNGYMTFQGLNSHQRSILKKMLETIVPEVTYAALLKDGEIVAVGLGVSECDCMGIYHVYVHEDFRRLGLGKGIMNALLAEARALGNTSTYLQVVADNDNAVGLYEQMGYEKQYDYWYRVKTIDK